MAFFISFAVKPKKRDNAKKIEDIGDIEDSGEENIDDAELNDSDDND